MSLGEPLFNFFLKWQESGQVYGSILFFTHIIIWLETPLSCSLQLKCTTVYFKKRVESMWSVSVILIGFVTKSKNIEKNIMYVEINVSHIRTKFSIDVSYSYVILVTFFIFHFFVQRLNFLFLSTHFYLVPYSTVALLRIQKISALQTDQWRRKSNYHIITNKYLHTYLCTYMWYHDIHFIVLPPFIISQE